MQQGRVLTWSVIAVAILSLAFVSTAVARDPVDPDPGPVFHEMNPGSCLVFPLFDIREGYDTHLRITNTSKTDSVRVQFNYNCGGTKEDQFCDALDRHEAITPYGTLVLHVPDHNPPCNEGYVLVCAENANHEAISFDHLIGSYHIKFEESGSVEASPAIAIQSLKEEGAVLGADDKLQFGTTAGDDPDYKALPSHLFNDFQAIIPPFDDDPGRHTELILLTLDTVAGGHNPVTDVDIKFWNEREVPFSTSWQFVCWDRVPLERIDFNFFADNLGTEYGAMAIWPKAKCPIAGGCPPLNKFDPTVLGAIDEFASSGRTKRNLFHDKTPKSTIYHPR